MKSHRISIIVADDHAVVRAGLRTIIDCEDDMTVVGEACNGRQAIAEARRLHPEVVVMDLMMPEMDGVEASKILCSDNPSTKVLILTSFGSSADLSCAVASGASGVLMKDGSNEELLSAIRALANGERYFHGEVAKLISAKPAAPTLTERQIEILQSCMRGFNTADIARQFGISKNGVKKHFESIFAKLGAATRTEAVAIAIEQQLLKI